MKMIRRKKKPLDEQALATVLASLRLFQATTTYEERIEMEHFVSCPPLNDKQIDQLCERFNNGEIGQ